MKIFYNDQKGVLLVAISQFKYERFREVICVREISRLDQTRQKLCSKPRALLADTSDEIVKKDSRVTVRCIHLVPGDAPPTPPRKVESQHAFSRSCPTADNCGRAGAEALVQRGEQA